MKCGGTVWKSDVVQIGRYRTTFRWYMLPPSSGFSEFFIHNSRQYILPRLRGKRGLKEGCKKPGRQVSRAAKYFFLIAAILLCI